MWESTVLTLGDSVQALGDTGPTGQKIVDVASLWLPESLVGPPCPCQGRDLQVGMSQISKGRLKVAFQV